MKNNVGVLVATHATVFLVGVVIGKKMDADELAVYRDAHESRFTRWTRKASNVAIGVGVLSTFIIIVRVTQRASAASGASGGVSSGTSTSS